MLNKLYFESFKESVDKIVWTSILSSPDLAVDSEKYLLHTKIPTSKKNRSPRLILHNEKIQERLGSMIPESSAQNKKRKASKTVSKSSNKKKK